MNFITSQKFTNLDFPVLDSGTDYLMGYPGDKIKAVTEFYVKVSSENIPVITSEDSSNNTIRRTDSGSFLKDGLRIGNYITTTGMGSDSGNYLISNVTDKVITISGTLGTTTTYYSAFIYRNSNSLCTASDFYYNLVENDAPDSFVSLVDTETQQRYTVSGISPTGTTGTYVIASNSRSWAVDGNGYGVIIEGLGVSDFKQYFRITHTFVITPIASFVEIENLQNGIPPATDSFADRRCLRYLCKIDMKLERTDPEIVDTVTFSRKGNTGWFGEFLNGQEATFFGSLTSYTYGGNPVDEIQYDDTTGTITAIELTSDLATFSTGSTAVLQIMYIAPDTDVVNTTRKFRDVFAYDRAVLVCGAAPVAGINLGTDFRQIMNASATYVNPSTITIACNFRMATALEAKISGKATDDRNYFIWASVQSDSVTSTKGTDRNAVIIDVNSYSKNLDDATLFTINPNVKFYDASGAEKGSTLNGSTGDIVRAVAPFQVKNSGSQKLTSIGVRIDAVHTGDTKTFTLEEWTANTDVFCLDDGVQEISISESKGYRLPSTSILNKITVDRNPSLDTASLAGYTLSYPFQLRYETWRFLDADCDFGDATQDWSVISNRSGWSIKAFVVSEVYDPATDHTTHQEQICDINVSSSPTGSTGTWGVVTTYDQSGVNNQFGDVLAYENTLVVADFYGDFSSLPAGTSGYYGVLFLDQQTIGGVNWAYPFSSQEDLRQSDGKSPWVGATGSTGTATVVIVSSTHIKVYAVLDFDKLDPNISNYNIRAKLDYLK